MELLVSKSDHAMRDISYTSCLSMIDYSSLGYEASPVKGF